MKLKLWVLAALSFALITSTWLMGQNVPGKSKPTPQQERLLLLHMVGRQSGTQLYQTYLNIGFIADGRAEGTYENKEVEQLLSSVMELLNVLDADLDQISKLDLSKEDREGVAQVQLIARLLRQQAAQLLVFWKTDDAEDGEKYERTRQEAWKAISELLKLRS
ncbi:MAG: hypothetical protein AB7K24_18265 [Gemmataceae bacterium]